MSGWHYEADYITTGWFLSSQQSQAKLPLFAHRQPRAQRTEIGRHSSGFKSSDRNAQGWPHRRWFILRTAVNATNQTSADSLSQRGLDLLAAGEPAQAARAFRAAIAADPAHLEAHHGLVRALRDAGRLEASVAAALALIALTPGDPLAHTALSISLQRAGHVPEAEAAAARARVLEWRIQLQSPNSQP
jgi:Flp pilus assembly protein TadD